DLIQQWFDHDEEASRAQTQMDNINKQMDDLQEQITEARIECEGGSARRRATGIELARYRGTGFLALPAPQSGGSASAVAARLRATPARLAQIPAPLHAPGPWLPPCLTPSTRGRRRRLPPP